MKKRNVTKNNLELYRRLVENHKYNDTRYYGLFLCGKDDNGHDKIKIDPVRFSKMVQKLSREQLAVIKKRKTHYFISAKYDYYDYNCNLFVDGMEDIMHHWHKQFKPLISREFKIIKKPRTFYSGDYHNFQCGISGLKSAEIWASIKNFRGTIQYEAECVTLTLSLYAEFFHFMSARIEALTVKILTLNNAIKDKFDRNILYATAVGKNKKIDELKSFVWYDKLYCLWNFIKHNSLSTYKTLKDRYPECLYDKNYEQGDLAIYFIKFENKMIEDILAGCVEFFKEYCELVFNENYNEAQWNYVTYFQSRVFGEIEEMENPLGLTPFDDID